MGQLILHYGLHIVAPLGIALLISRKKFWQIYLVLMLTMVVDMDHLWSVPIYQADRCSIGFHWLHSGYAIWVYLLSLAVFWKKLIVRAIFIGLLFHMVVDGIDCLWMFNLG